MAELKEKPREYYIPDNFIEEGRILSGRVKIRNLVEAIVMTVIVGIPVLLLVMGLDISMQTKISIAITFCAPPAIIGVIGFNGDSIFHVLSCLKKWKTDNQPMLYNHRPKLLREDPIAAIANETNTLEVLMEKYEQKKKYREDKKANIQYKEGTDFMFEQDASIDRYTKTRKQKDSEDTRKRSTKTKGKESATIHVTNEKSSGFYGDMKDEKSNFSDMDLF